MKYKQTLSKILKIPFYEEPNVSTTVYRLHFNENLLLPDEYYQEIINYVFSKISNSYLRYYTEPYNLSICELIANFHKIEPDMIFITSGGDEGIKLSLELTIHDDNKSLLVFEPTYSIPKLFAKSLDFKISKIPLVEYFDNFDLPDIESTDFKNHSIVYICNPNNPTGTLFKIDKIREIIENTTGFVIIDCVYEEFANISHLDLVKKYENVILVKSFSKVWGLAGIRVGYLITHPDIVKALKRFSLPHNITYINYLIIEKAIELWSYIENSIKQINKLRQYLMNKFNELEIRCYKSWTNFILFKVENAHEIYKKLYERGFILRYLGDNPYCRNCLRITIAKIEILDNFITILQTILKSF